MEGYILTRQAVCADDDIDLPFLEIAEDGTKLLRATGTRYSLLGRGSRVVAWRRCGNAGRQGRW